MSLTLFLIRGLPGSGKSTYAQTLGINHYEADMYFVNARGEYVFDPLKLKDAHQWCREQTRNSLLAGESCVVANTFVCRWEIEPYRQMAKQLGAQLHVIECHANYGNLHQVSDETIEKMKKRWQTWPNARRL